jgi:uncharacterized protein (DUF1330 family)
MPAFVVSEVEVLNEVAAERYRELAAVSIESHGGAYVVRGARPEAFEGEWPGSRRLVIVEFPSEEDARAWYASPEYAKALAIRRAALERRLLLADGVAREATARELLGRFHRAMLDLSADDLADLRAPDAVYELPLLSPARPDRYEGREAIRQGFREAWESAPVRVEVSSFNTGLRYWNGLKKKPAWPSYRLSVVVTRLSSRSVEVWGEARPARGRTTVSVYAYSKARKRYVRVARARTNPRGIFRKPVRRGSASRLRYQLRWRDASGTVAFSRPAHAGPRLRYRR